MRLPVIRPSLPYDAIGRKVGSAEDLLISMVTYGVQRGDKSIVLLDDIESVCGNNYEESTPSPMGGEATTTTGISNEPHLIARCRCLLLSLLEIVRLTPMDHVMLICTARNNWGKSIDRFDQVFVLENPSTHDRMKLFRYYIAKLQCQDDDDCKIDDSLSNLVECTSGLQYAELAFHCRGAMLEAIRAKASPLDFLRALKGQLQQAIPESLKTGAISDFVDMRVLTLRDFLDRNVLPHADSDLSAAFQCPLYGKSVEYAWEELQRLIITPLCKAGKLHDLMFHDGSSGGKIFAGGVLLAGLPGSGKSMLAYQCAALAALKNPSVKLLDVSCTSLIHKQLGSSEQAIHRLFTIAKSAAPCILLMDGIENVAAVRGNDNTTEGTMDRVLSTLLTELDGVDSQAISAENPACIAIIGITHNPEWVDPALRRPGRLERVIELGFPELDARQKIVERELSGIAFEGFMTSAASLIAEQTEGFSGAAVVGVCNEAKIRASTDTLIRADADNCPYAVTLHHINDAIASQLAGK